eukprot:351146-Chlamydomonas_euryale.AAC.3
MRRCACTGAATGCMAVCMAHDACADVRALVLPPAAWRSVWRMTHACACTCAWRVAYGARRMHVHGAGHNASARAHLACAGTRAAHVAKDALVTHGAQEQVSALGDAHAQRIVRGGLVRRVSRALHRVYYVEVVERGRSEEQRTLLQSHVARASVRRSRCVARLAATRRRRGIAAGAAAEIGAGAGRRRGGGGHHGVVRNVQRCRSRPTLRAPTETGRPPWEITTARHRLQLRWPRLRRRRGGGGSRGGSCACGGGRHCLTKHACPVRVDGTPAARLRPERMGSIQRSVDKSCANGLAFV